MHMKAIRTLHRTTDRKLPLWCGGSGTRRPIIVDYGGTGATQIAAQE